MLKDGTYSVWFKTPQGEGTGIIRLADGNLTGGDSFFSYSDFYEQNGDQFHATVKTARHSEGPSTIFGVDQVELSLEGRSNGAMASCTGMAKQAPNLSFKATLILAQDDVPRVGRTSNSLRGLTRGGYRSCGCVNTPFGVCIKVSAYRPLQRVRSGCVLEASLSTSKSGSGPIRVGRHCSVADVAWVVHCR